jgi:hypothetical protein
MPQNPINPDAADSPATAAFIERWRGVSASELSTAQSFVISLCDWLGVASPHATPAQDYLFERPVTFLHGNGSISAGRIDCYKRGHFVLEAKKLKAGAHTKGFDDSLLRARSQGEGYARALPASEGRPPFVLVVDVGTVIEVYAEFSRSGGTYTPFPDPRSHRILLADLARPEIRQRLRMIWTDPDRLNPARISAEVTRDVAALLAALANSLETDPATVANLMPAAKPAPASQSIPAVQPASTSPAAIPAQAGIQTTAHARLPENEENKPLALTPPAQVAPEKVASFLTRCLFSMFAEDIELLPKGAFLGLLKSYRDDPVTLQHMLRILWADMDTSGFSAALARPVLHFNGKLFKQPNADGYSLLLKAKQIDLLIQAAQANWREVEPAIFGTLLERALNPTERHALGAHYTPRAYVERLVWPTVIAPLRADWANAQAAALVLAHESAALDGKAQAVKLMEARAEVKKFHHQLCSIRVLDPACGSGNFLYVTLEHLKRLEGEVINQLEALGQTQDQLGFEGETVTLQQLRGIELNSRAAALAELVLWIGWLQWHIRTRGLGSVAAPVIHDYGNIECRDAVLAYDRLELACDATGQPITRWDGQSFKTHPATGETVPDEAAQMPQWVYLNPRQALWPTADFVVGNPPYLGARTVRLALGSGYLDALRATYTNVPSNADYVMYWWDRAARLVATGQARRFGLITTNSLRQSFNRAVLENHMGESLSLAFVMPDHPWVDSADGADVRVALSVAQRGSGSGRLFTVVRENPVRDGEVAIELREQAGIISPGLTIDIDVAAAPSLRANDGMSCVGYQLTGKGFVVDENRAGDLDPAFGTPDARIRPLLSGRDITQASRNLFAIDLYGLDEREVRSQFPAIYQWVRDRVKGERDLNADSASNQHWWLFARPRAEFRTALNAYARVITTSLTAKHRVFVFASAQTICDSTTVMFALPDAFHLGVLSSHLHVTWSLASNNRLGVGNDPRYIKTVCFENFPFPDADTGLTTELRQTIAHLAEQIDSHRKRVLGFVLSKPLQNQANWAVPASLPTAHHEPPRTGEPDPGPRQAQPTEPAKPAKASKNLTLTGLYNILDKLRQNQPLTPPEKVLHEQGLVSLLRTLHDELDAAVLQAYGWRDLNPVPWGNESARQAWTDTLLTRLAALNAQRTAEEQQGQIRWLRPAFQDPVQRQQQTEMLLNKELYAQIQQGLEADLAYKTAENPAHIGDGAASATRSDKNGSSASPQPWPATLPEQVKAVAQLLASAPWPLTQAQIEAAFKGRSGWKKTLPTLLETLVVLGRAQHRDEAGSAAWGRA